MHEAIADVDLLCDGVTYQGYCDGDVVNWCEGGALTAKDCAASGRVCAWQDDNIGFNCLSP